MDWLKLYPAGLNNSESGWVQIEATAAEDQDKVFWAQLAKAVDPRYERPCARPEVVVERLPDNKGAILCYEPLEKGKKARDAAYFQVAEEDLFLWERMNGQRTQVDLVVDYCLQYKKLAATRVAALVEMLREQNLLNEPADLLYPKLRFSLQKKTFGGRINSLTQTFLQREFPINGLDGLIGRVYRNGVWLLFTRPAQIIFWIVAISGTLLFIMLLNSGRFSLLGRGPAAAGALTLFFFQMIAIFQHELGHAFTVKAFGRKVRRAGLLILYGLPGAFVDTSDIWPAGRKAQLWVTWAGAFTNLITGGALAIVIAANVEADYAPLLFQIALTHYVLVTLNLTPFIRLDGYYLLSDLLQIPNLRPRSLGFWRNGVPHMLRQAWQEGHLLPRFNREQLILLVFGAVCGLWLINLLGLAVITAPIRLVDAIGFFLSGGATRFPITTLFFVGGLLLALLLLLRGLSAMRGWAALIQKTVRRAAPWRTALIYGGLALGVAALPDLLALQNPRAGTIYGHVFALAMAGLIVRYAARMVKELRGASLRRGLLGMATAGVMLLLVDSYAALQSLWPDTLPVLPHFTWLIALLPAYLVSGPAARIMLAMRRSAVGWTLVLGQIATVALIALALLPDINGSFLLLCGHAFYLAGLMLHWTLVLRPVSERILPPPPGQDMAGLLAGAFNTVMAHLVIVVWEIAGRQAMLQLVAEFNRRAAQAGWSVWLSQEAIINDKVEGTIEERAEIYRAASGELSGLLAEQFSQTFARDARAQAIIEMSPPFRTVYQRWLAEGQNDAASFGVEDDRTRLRLAGRRCTEGLVLGCARVYGWLLTERAIAAFNRSAALAHWPVYLRGNGRLTDESKGDLPEAARLYAEMLQDLLGRLAEITGITFIERGLVQVYDSLPWEVREVANGLLFPRLSWTRLLFRATPDQLDHLFLRSVPLLNWLAPAELAELQTRVKRRKLLVGQRIVARQSYLSQVMVVRFGQVQVLDKVAGVRQVVEQPGAGSLIGLNSLLRGEPVPFEYIAQTDVELWLLPPELVKHQLGPLLEMQGLLDEEQARLELLERIPLFAALESEKRRAVVQALEVELVTSGEVVLRAGDSQSRGFYIIRKGAAEVLIPTTNNAEKRVSLLGPGEFFGESSLLTRGPVTATVKALSELELLCLPAAEFYELMANNLAAALTQVQSRRSTERARMTQMVIA